MKKEKRGQASIITVILIILIVLVAVAIVWLVVKSAIDKSSKEIDVEPLSLKGNIDSFSLIDNFTVEVKITRGPGGGTIKGIKFIFEDSVGNNYIYTNTTLLLNELGSGIYLVSNNSLVPSIANFLNIKKVSVYYTYGDSGQGTSYKLDTKTSSFGGGGSSGGTTPPACTPSCSGRTCGDNGCGGSCGTCSSDTWIETGNKWWNETSICVGYNIIEERLKDYSCNLTNYSCYYELRDLRNITDSRINVSAGTVKGTCTSPNMCNGNGSCVQCIQNSNCDDGIYCNGVETCSLGVCQSGTPLTCNDGVSCTTDSCDEINNRCLFNNSECSCSVENQAINCNDNNVCTNDLCNASFFTCYAGFNTNSCNDNSACTNNDVCALGSCSGITITCSDSNECTGDSCDSLAGCVFTNLSLGTSCSIGECNGNGSCVKISTLYGSGTYGAGVYEGVELPSISPFTSLWNWLKKYKENFKVSYTLITLIILGIIIVTLTKIIKSKQSKKNKIHKKYKNHKKKRK